MKIEQKTERRNESNREKGALTLNLFREDGPWFFAVIKVEFFFMRLLKIIIVFVLLFFLGGSLL